MCPGPVMGQMALFGLTGFADKEKMTPQGGISPLNLAELAIELAIQLLQQVAVHAHMIDAHPAPEPCPTRIVKIRHRDNA